MYTRQTLQKETCLLLTFNAGLQCSSFIRLDQFNTVDATRGMYYLRDVFKRLTTPGHLRIIRHACHGFSLFTFLAIGSSFATTWGGGFVAMRSNRGETPTGTPLHCWLYLVLLHTVFITSNCFFYKYHTNKGVTQTRSWKISQKDTMVQRLLKNSS